MLFSIFLFVQNPFSSDAHACVNAMDEDKKSTNGAIPKGKRLKGSNTANNASNNAPNKTVNSPKTEKKDGETANAASNLEETKTSGENTPKEQKVEATKEQPMKIEKTPVAEKKQASACSSFGLLESLWMFVCTLPFLARFREE